MDGKGRPANNKKKLRSPAGGKRPKTSAFPKFRLNLKEPEKSPKVKHKPNARLHFRLGGDSTDPLNLNSLINRDPSEITPQCSPYVDRGKLSPCVVVQPKDAKDPLNLKCDVYQDFLVVTPARKKRKRKRNDSGCYEKEKDISRKENTPKIKKKKNDGKKKDENDIKTEKVGKDFKSKVVEKNNEVQEEKLNNSTELPVKIESPERGKITDSKSKTKHEEELTVVDNIPHVDIEEPSTDIKPAPKELPSQKIPSKNPLKKHSKKPKFKKNFIYGNYNRYYGYRNLNLPADPRLKLFHQDWFFDQDVLDIGCNIGNVTMQVARDFRPKHILGIDIDGALIKSANKNLRCAVQEHLTRTNKDFPMSFVLCRGPIISSSYSTEDKKIFPYNVAFKEENFVLLNDKALAKQKPTYDVMLCLSLTKWIHLNWGDEGMKRTFKRMFLMLRPGGKLLLEAQPFKSYSRRKNLTDKIRHHYDTIQFKPNQFVDFLMSEEVGFASYEVLGISENTSKGFQRPLYLFTKSSSGECHDALGENIADNYASSSTPPTTSHYYFD